MKKSKRHDRSVIQAGINKHKRPGEIPRAESIDFNALHVQYAEVMAVYRDGHGFDLSVVVELDDGCHYEVRTRTGVKYKSQMVGDKSDWIAAPSGDGYTRFQDDFTIKEVEYHLYRLMDEGVKLPYWKIEGEDKIIIPTDKGNEPPINEEFFKSLTLSGNRALLERRDVSKAAILRLELAGYLDKMPLELLDNTDEWREMQAIIDEDEDTQKARSKRIDKTIKKAKAERNFDFLYEYYHDLGSFEVRDATETITLWYHRLFPFIPKKKKVLYQYLLMWDTEGRRIYHTRKMATPVGKKEKK